MTKVESIKAYIAQNEEGEGIVGFLNEGTWVPMVCADDATVAKLRPLVLRVAQETGKKITLVKFSQREDVEVIDGTH